MLLQSKPRSCGSLAYDYIVVLAAALALYGLTVAPGPLWQDNGLAQLRVLRHDLQGDLGLALSHPLFYVLAIAFQALPFGESALKTNLVGVLFGAVTVANVYLLLGILGAGRVGATAGAGALAVAHTFWQMNVMAEVYAVSTVLLSLELLCLARYAETGRRAWLVGLLLANGLGVSNHLLATLHLPLWVGLLIWLIRRRQAGVGTLAAAGAAWLLGAGLFLWLIAREWASGQPLPEVLRSALFGYSHAANVLNFHLSSKLLVQSGLYLILNFPTPTALFFFVGLAAMRRLRCRVFSVALAAALVIHLIWAIRYDVPDQYTFFITPVLLIAIIIGLGAGRFLRARSKAWVAGALVLTFLPPVVYVPLPSLARAAGVSLGTRREIPYRDSYTYFLRPWKTAYHGPRRFAEECRESLPAGAVLFGDQQSLRPVHYLMLTGRWRNDVQVWPQPVRPYGSPLWPDAAEMTEELQSGRLFVVSPTPYYCPGWLLEGFEFEKVGVLYRVIGAPSAEEPASDSYNATNPAVQDQDGA